MYPNPDMTTIELMCSKIITEILFALSDDEVKQYVAAAVDNFEQETAAGKTQLRLFIDTSLRELEKFSPMNEEALQWNNIRMARICFFRQKLNLDNVQAKII